MLKGFEMGEELNVGDRIKDNDPRSHRTLTINEVGEKYVWAVWAARLSRIRRDRIHTDGKPRRSGFSLVRAAASLAKE